MDTNLKKIRQVIRDEIGQHPVLIDSLKRFANHDAAFYPGYGNLGDALIAVGTADLFDDLGWAPKLIHDRHRDSLSSYSHVVMGGGGGWVKGLWEGYIEQTLEFLKNGGKMLILPSSFSGFGSEFVAYADQIIIFCREQQSYDELLQKGMPEDQIFLCHDLAFYAHEKHFSDLNVKRHYPCLKILRRDEESAARDRPRDSVDLPLLFNDIQWTTRAECLPPLRAVAGLINQFECVETDRLHMAILSTLIGRIVKVTPSNYFKIRAVFEYTLHRFPTVSFQKQVSDYCDTKSNDAEHIKKLKLELYAEWEQRVIIMRKNDALSEDVDNLQKKLKQKNYEYRQAFQEKDRNFDYISQELARLSKKNNEELKELKELKEKLEKIQSSRFYRWSEKYYSLFRIPGMGVLLRGVRKSILR